MLAFGAWHSAWIAGTVAHGVNDQLVASDLIEYQ